jgi:hypothetical protein
MLVSIHQPEFLPWLPFFDKVDRSSRFVLLDNVQFEKNYFHNRCKIRNGKGAFQLITIPVKKGALESSLIEKEIDRENRLIRKTLSTIRESYSKAPFLSKYFPSIEQIVLSHQFLGKMNIDLIHFAARELGIKAELINASALNVPPSEGSERIANIVQNVGGTEYLSGPFGVDYLDENHFKPKGIKVHFHEHSFPTYWQFGEPTFIPALSVLDLLFNGGPGSYNLVRENPAKVAST